VPGDTEFIPLPEGSWSGYGYARRPDNDRCLSVSSLFWRQQL